MILPEQEDPLTGTESPADPAQAPSPPNPGGASSPSTRSSTGPYPGLLAWPQDELEHRVVELGGRPFHARVARTQLLGKGVLEYAQMTSLPARLREALASELPLLASEEVRRVQARDGTTKLLLRFSDRSQPQASIPPNQDSRGVETVHIPGLGSKAELGSTLCVSTQMGCPMACPFCASGLDGLTRNLTPDEIMEQFARGRALGPLRRAVIMGIGEPLLNLDNLTQALQEVQQHLELGARKITVSTVGFPDRLERAARNDPRFQLAISLHTPDDDQHDELIPAMAGTPIEDILTAGDDWFEVTGREVTYEYVLLGGVNDSQGHAARLAQRIGGRRATVNLIPYNPTRGLDYERPHPEDVQAFAILLQEAGVVATVRYSRGADGAAACGQLRSARH